MNSKAKNIGDRPIGPTNPDIHSYDGMTYRQWLIGMALSNPNIARYPGLQSIAENTHAAVAHANALLALLATEED